MKTKIHYREKMNREFLCRKCNTWVLNSRDIIEETIDDNGTQTRKYECIGCKTIHEFSGHRYSDWNKLGDKKKNPKKKKYRIS